MKLYSSQKLLSILIKHRLSGQILNVVLSTKCSEHRGKTFIVYYYYKFIIKVYIICDTLIHLGILIMVFILFF